MTTAVFPGSFDPPTYGHLNIIERASKLFDSVDVVIAVNPEKRSLFTANERLSMIQELTKNFDNVSVHQWEGLVVDYAKKNEANILLRGIRNSNDFAYEFDLSLMNHTLNAQIETLFIPTEQKYAIIKSSSIKELAMFGGDISGMVPPIVADEMRKKCVGAKKSSSK
ncbi:MAG: pantetheine-phosphate adenylyltransferase [Treponema sp.]|nr:pantetheine-phosphate adenylyltransferase [Treponema sp.]